MGFIYVLLKTNIKIRQNITLSVGTFFLIWFVFEIILRFSSLKTTSEKASGYYFFPNNVFTNSWYFTHKNNSSFGFSIPEFSYYRKTNSMGLCDEEPYSKNDTNELLIIGLGDSFTEGVGTNADSTWLKVLEHRLASKQTKKVRTINAGISGSDPIFEYMLLKDKLLVFKPDIVILAVGYELEEISARGGNERFIGNGQLKYKELNFSDYLFSLFYTYRLIYYKLLIPNGFQEGKRAKAVQELIVCLNDFAILSEENNFKFLIVIYPQIHEVFMGKYDYWQEIIPQIKKDFPIVDLLDYYSKELKITGEELSNYYWLNDGHHNEEGYSAFAKGVEKGLLDAGMIEYDIK
ncbi:MAG: SGNH/GDSL hydrolase family protein [Bacteroidales bacterium]|nr:SGNH/GDSL hydrolase family protein [Bacteroidales bacterium]